MLHRMTSVISALAVVALISLSSSAFSQTPGGRSALAAKQRLKTEVLDAMADGSISKLERAEILAGARDVLTVKEYEGLQATMDRLSPSEKMAEAKRAVSDRVARGAAKQKQEPPMFLSKVFSGVPYIDDLSVGPRPQASDIAKSMPYVKPRSVDVSGMGQALARAPRLSDMYLDAPSAASPLPKVRHVEKDSAPIRTAIRPSPTHRSQMNTRRPASRYADESLSPSVRQTEAVETGMLRQPRKTMKEMSPLADASYLENAGESIAMPVGAVLPDRNVPAASADFVQPMQPEGLEAEYLR